MFSDVAILIADDDIGHARLVEKNFRRAGLSNPIVRFEDGQEVLDYIGLGNVAANPRSMQHHMLLLDIRMPRIDGIEVLRQVKQHPEVRKMPVIMLTTTDDPREVERCHFLGCNGFVAKPVDYDRFATVVTRLASYLSIVRVP